MQRPLDGRVLLIGDVHQEDAALELVLSWARSEAIAHVLCVGDLADGRGDLGRCCRYLQEAAAFVVRGNHDRWALRGTMRGLPDAAAADQVEAQRTFLEALPATRSFETPRGRLLLCHGVGDDDMARLGADDDGYALENNLALQELLAAQSYEIVVGGHTHRRMVRQLAGVTFINVGTLYREHQPCVATLDLHRGVVEFFDVTDDGLTSSELCPL